MVNRYSFWAVLGLWLVGTPVFSQTDSLPLFSFGVMTDVQYCDCDTQGSRHYRSSLRKLNEAVQTFNQKNVAFVTHLGDFIDRDFQSYDTLTTLIRQLNRPLYQVLGNHDFSVEQNEIEKVPSTLRMPKRYYSFVRNQWRFILLDGNDLSMYGNPTTSKTFDEATRQLDHLKTQKAANAQTWNGGLGSKQIQWLKKELTLSAIKGEKVIILCHFPLMPEGDQHLLWNAAEVQNLLEKHPNVLAYFNGHVHQPSHLQNNGIHYVTFRGMVEKEENGYAIVDVYRDYVKIVGYEAETSRVLKKSNPRVR